MKIEEFRPHFYISILDSNPSRGLKVEATLLKAGYNVNHHIDPETFIHQAEQLPPHVLFLEQDTLIILGEGFIDEILDLLPELHVIIYAKQDELYSTSQFIPRGVYDCVAYSEENLDFLILSADRAAERDYFMYMNEQLQEGSEDHNHISNLIDDPKTEVLDFEPAEVLPSIETHPNSSNEKLIDFQQWMNQLNELQNIKEAIGLFLEEMAKVTEAHRIIYLKYIHQHNSLVVFQESEGSSESFRGLAIPLAPSQFSGVSEWSKNPEKLSSLIRFVEDTLGEAEFITWPFSVNGKVEGLFLFTGVHQEILAQTYPQLLLLGLTTRVNQLQLVRKLQLINTQDEKTRLLNKEAFLDVLRKEMFRAQRISSPVTLLNFIVDQQDEIDEDLNSYEQDLLFRMLAKILRKHSRINDVIARFDKFKFSILLPHTGKLGGAIKAERLRRIIEAADFSRITPNLKSITISMGVSEYPSHGKNYQDLIMSADEAIQEVKRTGFNKVCLASPPNGFVPDFTVEASKL